MISGSCSASARSNSRARSREGRRSAFDFPPVDKERAYDIIDAMDKVAKAFERNMIEIAPLAFMRGRTLNNAFVILDEAQNTTPEQMKMFLTRIGFGTKAVITGDVTQIDLARSQKSGLIEARRVLKDVRGIAFTDFTSADVVRHPLVQKIISAYEQQTHSERIDAPGAPPTPGR